MKTKTRKNLQRVVLFGFVFLFSISTLLLYLPLTQSSPSSTPPPAIQDIPGAQNGQGGQQVPPDVLQQLNQQKDQSSQGAPGAPGQPSVTTNGAAQPNPPAPGAQTQNNPLQGAPAQ